MKLQLVRMAVFMWFLLGLQTAYAATVAPIVNNYGNVFPVLTEVNLDTFRSGDPAPWYVTFNLLTTADVKLGALAHTSSNNGTGFNITAIRLVTIDGTNVAFGTDTFTNPFTNVIDRLVVADALSSGEYALEVSGSGNRTYAGRSYTYDATDFMVRLQVTPSSVPVPAATWLFSSGLIGLLGIARRHKNS